MKELLDKFKSRSSRALLEALWKKAPGIPVPTLDEAEDCHWNGVATMYKDYIDDPVYKVHGKRVTEAAFIKFLLTPVMI